MRIIVFITILVVVCVRCSPIKSSSDKLVISSNGFDEIYDACFLKNGDRIVCGVAEGKLIFEESTDSGFYAGSYDALVTAFDSLGKMKWNIVLGDAEWDEANSICKDASDNIYISGHFNGRIVLSNDTLFSRGQSDIFIIKLNPEGRLLKWRSFGSYGKDESADLVLHNSSLYFYGMYSGKLNDSLFGNTMSTYKGNLDNCIIRFDTDLNAQKFLGFGGSAEEMAGEIKIDDNRLLVCGGFTDTLEIGNKKYFSNGLRDIFVASFNLDFELLDFYSEGGKGDDYANSVLYNGSNIIWAGQYTPEGRNDYDVIINVEGRKFVYGSDKNDWAKGLCKYKNNEWLLSSVIQDSVFLAGKKFLSAGSYDNLILKINSKEGITSSYSFGSTGEDGFSKLMCNDKNEIWACGWFSGGWLNENMKMDSGVRGNSDGIMVKIKIP